MAEPFLGEIRMFGCTFAPKNWAFCDGQFEQIMQNEALYALLGLQFGGDGRTTFQLPDLRGRVPRHRGPISYGKLGIMGGRETVTLTEPEMGAHTHDFIADADPADKRAPVSSYTFAATAAQVPIYGPAPATSNRVAMNTNAIGSTGGGGSHTNVQPSSVVNFCIALTGLFPSRN